MARIVFNGHGGRAGGPAGHPPPFIVPAGVAIHFYVADGVILDNADGWRLLEWLQGGAVGPAPVAPITVTAGNFCQDYYGVPYMALEPVQGVWLQDPTGVYVQVLRGLDSQRWGAPTAHTVNVGHVELPSVLGGPAYARNVIWLHDLANCPTVTEVHWLSCREVW